MHAMFGGRGFRGFVLIAIGKMEILATFPHFQDEKEVIRRYEGWYHTNLVYYYNIFYFETDWSRIRPLPSTTLVDVHKLTLEEWVTRYCTIIVPM